MARFVIYGAFMRVMFYQAILKGLGGGSMALMKMLSLDSFMVELIGLKLIMLLMETESILRIWKSSIMAFTNKARSTRRSLILKIS
jgi:hypothetical protein